MTYLCGMDTLLGQLLIDLAAFALFLLLLRGVPIAWEFLCIVFGPDPEEIPTLQPAPRNAGSTHIRAG
jgi:hypothetical protein